MKTKQHLIQKISHLSLVFALWDKVNVIDWLKRLVPDVSDQETGERPFNDYWELKMRGLHAFQYDLMMQRLRTKDSPVVVDIGDSAGTHILYLKKMFGGLSSLSVNIDNKAVEKIGGKGLKAILSRAEDLYLYLANTPVDLFVSFEMVEHLHNPALFFRNLTKCKGDTLIITVPYLEKSRVGLHSIRKNACKPITAEEEHIFELSPEDWTLLIRHSGWRVAHSEIYYQYPRWPLVGRVLQWFWRRADFEGFWGAVLTKNTTCSDCYKDWEE